MTAEDERKHSLLFCQVSRCKPAQPQANGDVWLDHYQPPKETNSGGGHHSFTKSPLSVCFISTHSVAQIIIQVTLNSSPPPPVLIHQQLLLPLQPTPSSTTFVFLLWLHPSVSSHHFSPAQAAKALSSISPLPRLSLSESIIQKATRVISSRMEIRSCFPLAQSSSSSLLRTKKLNLSGPYVLSNNFCFMNEHTKSASICWVYFMY